MSEQETREQILDLLARGKISIDEAVGMLDQSEDAQVSPDEDELLYKAEIDQSYDVDSIVKIKLEDNPAAEAESVKEKIVPESEPNGDRRQPRWLRVQVTNSETGKSKVRVNVPFGMVKFGMGVARMFSPEMKGVDLDEVSEMLNHAESGLLVDVQDDESNEHVKVFFE